MSTTQILVVDRDRERAQQVADRARCDDWGVTVSSDVAGAQRELASRPIALALVDSSVWEDGSFVGWVEAHQPALPVIVLTGRDVEADGLIEQLRLGAMTFVPRDADSRRLVETVRALLGLTRRNPYRESVSPFLRSGSVELQIGNDPAFVPVVVGYYQRVLEDYGLSQPRPLMRLGVALTEAVTNAIVHGNLGVSSALRADRPERYYAQIEERRGSAPFRERVVDIAMRISQSAAAFVVRDQGEGFDRATLPDPLAPENLLAPSGRGILLMRTYCDTVSWNEKGTEVTLTKVLKEEKKKGEGVRHQA